jgi:thiol-disulfide isomerase/thioredoxin
MNQTVTLGPLVLSALPLVGWLGAVLGGMTGSWAGRRQRVDPEPTLFRALLAGLLAARLAFVAQFHAAYAQAPLSMLDLRDGGWSPAAGFAVATMLLVVVAIRRKLLRAPLAIAVGTAATVWVMGAAALASFPEGEGQLPALTLQDLQGKDVALSTFRGRPTVVNLWATWCPPCRRELPMLQQAQAEQPGVHFVFLDQGESAERVRSFLAAQDLPLRNVLLDLHGQAGTRLASRALPTTPFFDASGHLVATRVGELSRGSLAQRLAASSTPP